MVKMTRKQYDEIGAVLIKNARELEPGINLQRLFGRLYGNTYKQNKLQKELELKEQTKTLKPITKAKKV